MSDLTQPIGTPLAAGSAHVSGTRALSITVEREPESPAIIEVTDSVAVEVAQEAADAVADETTGVDVANAASLEVAAVAEFQGADTVAIEGAAIVETTETAMVPDIEARAETVFDSAPIVTTEDIAPVATVPSQPLVSTSTVSDAESSASVATEFSGTEAPYEDTLELMQQASRTLNVVFNETGTGVTKLSFSMIKFVHENAKNNWEFARDSISVRSIPEIFEVQKSYVRRQFDLLTSQVEAVQSLTAEVAAKTVAPFKEQPRN